MKFPRRIALFNVFVVALNVHVTAAALCATVDDVKKDVATWVPPPIILELDNARTAAFLKVYNAVPPATNVTADHAVVIANASSPRLIFVIFDEKCALMTYIMPKAFFISVMGRAKVEGTSI